MSVMKAELFSFVCSVNLRLIVKLKQAVKSIIELKIKENIFIFFADGQIKGHMLVLQRTETQITVCLQNTLIQILLMHRNYVSYDVQFEA